MWQAVRRRWESRRNAAGRSEIPRPPEVVDVRIPIQGHFDAAMKTNPLQRVELKTPAQRERVHGEEGGQKLLEQQYRWNRLHIREYDGQSARRPESIEKPGAAA